MNDDKTNSRTAAPVGPAGASDVGDTSEGLPELRSLVELRRVLARVPSSKQGIRDRALITLAWWGRLRRNELVALRVSEVEFPDAGMRVLVRKSGELIALCYSSVQVVCPVSSVWSWIVVAERERGPLFRHVARDGEVGGRINGGDVDRIIKRAVGDAGFNAAECGGPLLWSERKRAMNNSAQRKKVRG